MPQIFQPQVLQDRNYNNVNANGVFPQLFAQAAAPLAAEAGKFIGKEVFGFTTPQEEQQEIANEEAQRKIATDQVIAARGMSPEQRTILNDRLKASGKWTGIDDPALQGTADQVDETEQYRRRKQELGYDFNTGKWNEELDPFPEVKLPSQQPQQPRMEGSTVGEFTSPTSDLISAGQSQLESGVAADAATFDFTQATNPDYLSTYLPQVKDKLPPRQMSIEEQRRAGSIADKMMALRDNMKIFRSPELSSPEQIARIHSTARSVVSDIDVLVDGYNDTHKPSISISAYPGGSLGAVQDINRLAVLTSAPLQNSMTQGQRDAAAKEASAIINRMQKLSAYQLTQLTELGKRIPQNEVAAILEQDKAGKALQMKAREIANDERQTSVNLMNANVGVQRLVMEQNENLWRRGFDMSKLQVDYDQNLISRERIAADLGISSNRNAIEYLTLQESALNHKIQNELTARDQDLRWATEQQKAQLRGMGKTAATLQNQKLIQSQIEAAKLLENAGTPKQREAANTIKDNIADWATLTGASLLATEANKPGNLLAQGWQALTSAVTGNRAAAGPTTPGPISNSQGPAISEQIASEYKNILGESLRNGTQLSIEFYNAANHIKAQRDGSVALDDGALVPNGTKVVRNGKVVESRDETLHSIASKVSTATIQGKVTKLSMSQFLDLAAPGGTTLAQALPTADERKRAYQIYLNNLNSAGVK